MATTGNHHEMRLIDIPIVARVLDVHWIKVNNAGDSLFALNFFLQYSLHRHKQNVKWVSGAAVSGLAPSNQQQLENRLHAMNLSECRLSVSAMAVAWFWLYKILIDLFSVSTMVKATSQGTLKALLSINLSDSRMPVDYAMARWLTPLSAIWLFSHAIKIRRAFWMNCLHFRNSANIDDRYFLFSARNFSAQKFLLRFLCLLFVSILYLRENGDIVGMCGWIRGCVSQVKAPETISSEWF